MRSLKQSLTNIRRTPYQALAAVSVLSITFFISVIFSFISVSLYQALHYFETRPQVLIYYKPNANPEDIEAMRQALIKYPGVVDIRFVNQDEALKIYRDLNKNDPLLLELVTSSILPSSLEVSTNNLNILKQIQLQAATAPGVDEAVLRTDVIDLLNKWLNGIKLAGTVFISIMGITSLIIIVIVVGMKIAGKNYEIKILQLIGATPWYIKSPYLIEGGLYGLVSAFIAYLGALTLLLYTTPSILKFSGEVPLLPLSVNVLLIIFALIMTIGWFIGTFGSWIAVKRFLK
jgi:cell division transport system permease protein